MPGSGGNAGGARPAVAAALLLALVLALVPAPEAAAARRVALVVGNGAYEQAGPLRNPVNDANDMAAALRGLGFEVILGLDLDRDGFYDKLATFADASHGAEAALFFYAGHGIQADGANYVAPVDVALTNTLALKRGAIELGTVLQQMRGETNLVFLDACRDNPMATAGTRGVGRGLARVKDVRRGALIAFATRPGGVAADGDGRNSPFTAALLEHIGRPGESVTDMLTSVTATVLERTAERQEPWVNLSLTRKFYFAPGEAPLAGTVAAPGAPPAPSPESEALIAADRVFWESAERGGTASGYEAYLEAFPSGVYAALARDRLARLGDSGVVSSPGPVPAPVPSGPDHGALESGLGLGREARVALQSGLNALGFDAGPADGAVGPRTRRAISSWQSAKGYEATAYLTEEQAEALIAAGREARDRAEREAAGREERAGRARDDAAFDAARRSDTASAYEVYLSLYPSGAHVSEAERLRAARVAATRDREERAARARDDAAFAAARRSDTVSAYEGYLSAYRSGAHVSEARRLRKAAADRERVPAVGEVFRDCPHCPEMVVVPSGRFMMGSPPSEEGRDDDEGPQHRVTIGSSFAVGVHEVTRGEFGRFVSATNRSMGDSCWTWENGEGKGRSGRGWRNPGFSQRDAHPVVCVSWNDARAYVRWLSGETGASYRLLSESEWEYVARGGTQTRYWWGDSSSSQCRYANGADASSGLDWGVDCDDGYSRTSPVGSFGGNSFGLHDVHGNVWEWVQNCRNESYAGAPRNGSAWESGECSRRVLRGGSWYSSPGNLRAALRFGNVTGNRSSVAGFRVARTFTP